jgi:uncharacterized protein YegP (UPF0339 family)
MRTICRTSLLFVLAGLIVSAGLGTVPAQDKGKQKTDPKAKVDPKAKADQKGAAAVLTFEVYKDAGDKFRWRLKSADGTNIGMAPHGYETKAECQKMIDEIKGGAARAKVEEQS